MGSTHKETTEMKTFTKFGGEPRKEKKIQTKSLQIYSDKVNALSNEDTFVERERNLSIKHKKVVRTCRSRSAKTTTTNSRLNQPKNKQDTHKISSQTNQI